MGITDLEKYLAEHSVRTILLHLENSLAYVELIHFLGQKDYHLILLNPRELSTKISTIESKSPIDLVITGEITNIPYPQLVLENLLIPKLLPSEYLPSFKADVSILSSGTENLKLYQFNLAELFTKADTFVEHFDLSNANFILSISFASIAGLNLLLRSWQAKGSIEFELEEAFTFEDSVVSLFPTQLRIWHQERPELIQRLEASKIIFLGGEVLDPVSEKIIHDYHLPVVMTYALTESGGTVAYKNIYEDFYQALPGNSFKLLGDNSGANQEPDQLIIINQLTGSQILTNDLVELISAEKIKTISRKKTAVNRGGFKFQTQHLEQELSENFEFKHLLCLKVSDLTFGEKVICCYQGGPSIRELEEWSKANLAVYLQPEFLELDIWPVLPNGKTDIRKLTSKAYTIN